MKKLLFLIAGATGAAAYFLIRQKPKVSPAKTPAADDLAHRLQEAWADHHTVA